MSKELLIKWGMEGSTYDSVQNAVKDVMEMADVNKILAENPQGVKIIVEIELIPIRAEDYEYFIKIYKIQE